MVCCMFLLTNQHANGTLLQVQADQDSIPQQEGISNNNCYCLLRPAEACKGMWTAGHAVHTNPALMLLSLPG